jgi:hypothetical protein
MAGAASGGEPISNRAIDIADSSIMPIIACIAVRDHGQEKTFCFAIKNSFDVFSRLSMGPLCDLSLIAGRYNPINPLFMDTLWLELNRRLILDIKISLKHPSECDGAARIGNPNFYNVVQAVIFCHCVNCHIWPLKNCGSTLATTHVEPADNHQAIGEINQGDLRYMNVAKQVRKEAHYVLIMGICAFFTGAYLLLLRSDRNCIADTIIEIVSAILIVFGLFAIVYWPAILLLVHGWGAT